MRKFNVRVNGRPYEVEVEEVAGRPAADGPLPSPVRRSAPEPPKKPAPAAGAAGTTVFSPMPGTILAIKVTEGEMVVQGQVLLILEAMKMENEIPAPVAGKIISVAAAKGATVNTGDALVVIQ
ncbi:MAG: biotin/lipoyl-containing protein [PVC group bacterium]